MHFSLNNRLAFIDADVLILMNLKNLESGSLETMYYILAII